MDQITKQYHLTTSVFYHTILQINVCLRAMAGALTSIHCAELSPFAVSGSAVFESEIVLIMTLGCLDHRGLYKNVLIPLLCRPSSPPT